MSTWEETTYPVPDRPVRVECGDCGDIVSGHRGAQNVRGILKDVKAHEEERHPPYEPTVIGDVITAVDTLNAGAAEAQAGRYRLVPADSASGTGASTETPRTQVPVRLGDIDRAHVERSIEEFDRIGRDAFLDKYGFGPARAYFVVVDGRRYDSKAIVGAAYQYAHPEVGPLRSSEFSGGDATVKALLERLGFELSAPTNGSHSLPDLLGEVLDLQPAWQSTNTAEMQRRGELIRSFIPARLRAFLTQRNLTLSVEGRDGTGRKTRVPWVRLYSPSRAPRATSGWYVVYLFAFDGSAVYLSLNQGTTEFEDGDFRPRPTEELEARVAWARQLLGDAVEPYNDTVDLRDTRTLGAAYELGNVCARAYSREAMPSEGEMQRDLSRFLELLDEVYDASPRADQPSSTTHILLRWQVSRNPRTLVEHRAIADARGSVWWGKFGRGMTNERVAAFKSNLDSGTIVHAYLVGSDGTLARATLRSITNDASDIDESALPPYYSPADCGTFFELTDFVDLDLAEIDQILVSESNPVPGSITKALGGQGSVMMYVLERIPDTPPDEAQHWIFQANPNNWDLREYLATARVGDESDWYVGQYANRMHAGDQVAFWMSGPDAGVYALGELIGPVFQRPASAWRESDASTEPAAPFRLTAILPQPILRTDLVNHPVLKDLGVITFRNATNFAVTPTHWDALMALIDLRPPPVQRLDPLRLQQLAEQAGLVLDERLYIEIVAAIHARKHVMLTGAPGTAKTTLAEIVAAEAASAGWCRGHTLTTATSDWTTYETIGGLHPGEEGLRFEAGQFLAAIQSNHWLVIDELNRSNFDRAFGQLFTVLSGQSVTLPYNDAREGRPITLAKQGDSRIDRRSHTVIEVPDSWRIIATMNVFDKSLLFEMSFALMRRFAFIEVPCPSIDTYTTLIEREAEPHASRVLDIVRPLLELRTVKELGPALFMDLARHAGQRLELDDAPDPEIRFQLFYSYLLPQFEGVTEAQGATLYARLRRQVASPSALRDTLNAVLGLQLGTRGPNRDDEDDDDVDTEELE